MGDMIFQRQNNEMNRAKQVVSVFQQKPALNMSPHQPFPTTFQMSVKRVRVSLTLRGLF